MLAKNHPELEKAVFCARKMSLLERWRDYQFHRNLWKVDERMLKEQARLDGHAEGKAEGLAEGKAEGLAEGKAKGLAEGLAEGHTEEKLEIARNLKKMGLSTVQVSEGTGLPTETIQKL